MSKRIESERNADASLFLTRSDWSIEEIESHFHVVFPVEVGKEEANKLEYAKNVLTFQLPRSVMTTEEMRSYADKFKIAFPEERDKPPLEIEQEIVKSLFETQGWNWQDIEYRYTLPFMEVCSLEKCFVIGMLYGGLSSQIENLSAANTDQMEMLAKYNRIFSSLPFYTVFRHILKSDYVDTHHSDDMGTCLVAKCDVEEGHPITIYGGYCVYIGLYEDMDNVNLVLAAIDHSNRSMIVVFNERHVFLLLGYDDVEVAKAKHALGSFAENTCGDDANAIYARIAFFFNGVFVECFILRSIKRIVQGERIKVNYGGCMVRPHPYAVTHKLLLQERLYSESIMNELKGYYDKIEPRFQAVNSEFWVRCQCDYCSECNLRSWIFNKQTINKQLLADLSRLFQTHSHDADTLKERIKERIEFDQLSLSAQEPEQLYDAVCLPKGNQHVYDVIKSNYVFFLKKEYYEADEVEYKVRFQRHRVERSTKSARFCENPSILKNISQYIKPRMTLKGRPPTTPVQMALYELFQLPILRGTGGLDKRNEMIKKAVLARKSIEKGRKLQEEVEKYNRENPLNPVAL